MNNPQCSPVSHSAWSHNSSVIQHFQALCALAPHSLASPGAEERGASGVCRFLVIPAEDFTGRGAPGRGCETGTVPSRQHVPGIVVTALYFNLFPHKGKNLFNWVTFNSFHSRKFSYMFSVIYQTVYIPVYIQ